VNNISKDRLHEGLTQLFLTMMPEPSWRSNLDLVPKDISVALMEMYNEQFGDHIVLEQIRENSTKAMLDFKGPMTGQRVAMWEFFMALRGSMRDNPGKLNRWALAHRQYMGEMLRYPLHGSSKPFDIEKK
jgi:hypothetical protein